MFMFASTLSHPDRLRTVGRSDICSCLFLLCHIQIGYELLGGLILCSCLLLLCHIQIGYELLGGLIYVHVCFYCVTSR